MILVRMLVLGLATLVMSTVVAQDKKAEKLDPAKLVGKWKLTEGVKAGEKSGDDAKKGTTEVTKDKITLANADATFVFGYKVDAAKTPAEVDFEILEPEGLKGAKAKGIIKLEGGKMTMCYHPMMGDRPTKFESTKDNGFYLFTFKAAEEKKKEEKKAEKKEEKK